MSSIHSSPFANFIATTLRGFDELPTIDDDDNSSLLLLSRIVKLWEKILLGFFLRDLLHQQVFPKLGRVLMNNSITPGIIITLKALKHFNPFNSQSCFSEFSSSSSSSLLFPMGICLSLFNYLSTGANCTGPQTFTFFFHRSSFSDIILAFKFLFYCSHGCFCFVRWWQNS